MTLPRVLPVPFLLVLPVAAAAQTNHPPNAPRITEPTAANLVLNPNDVHMETAPFSDPDPGDMHAASDWEIRTVSPSQRVWHASGVTGIEKVHVHLGDGQFENSHAGWRRLFENTQFMLRVRHKDDSGVAATEWSAWTSILFWTGPANVNTPLLLDDIALPPAPTWLDTNGAPIDLPTGTPNPMLRLETDNGFLLLRIDAAPGLGNRFTNPPPLPSHRPVRVVIEAGNTGANLVLPATDLTASQHGCATFTVRLPAIILPPGGSALFWVSAEGATYVGTGSPRIPDFGTPARGLDPPWLARQPGYTVDVVAGGLALPVNLAFVPNAGTNPGDPKLYVTELWGTIKAISNDGTVSTYASGLLNYQPSSNFPGSGEQGMSGIAVDPVSGDVFVSHLWHNSGARQNYPRITRLTSTDGGRTASSRQVILDMQGEAQGQSHMISRLEIVGGELYCHMGDGMNAATALDLSSYRGKILRLNLDGSPIASNPFYNGGSRDSRDYIFAYGLRNPFGGAWRQADGYRYEVENGPDIDRFARVVAGRSYGWNGANTSMRLFALHNWNPPTGPVNLAFVQPGTFGGSGFPPERMDHAFVTESGSTYAQGQQTNGKRITEFVLDASGNLVSGPIPFVEYVGNGFATAVGLAAGPDGLYFTELYEDSGSGGPTGSGARVLRVSYGDPDDCNANGVPDWCEIQSGTEQDCNGNGVPDSCDLQSGVSHDFDGNATPDECDPLFASTDRLSLSTGGRVDFVLEADPSHAGLTYLLVGSMSGTAPGTPLGPVILPLNTLNDPWTALSASAANSATFSNTLATLDANGHSTAALVLPANLPASAVGLQLHHAYVVIDRASGQFAFASNAVPLNLKP